MFLKKIFKCVPKKFQCFSKIFQHFKKIIGLFSILFILVQCGGENKDTAMRLTNCLVNVRAITSHFQPRIDAWLATEQVSTPTEDQILEVVRANYDSLTLKLQDSLDQSVHLHKNIFYGQPYFFT